MNRVVKGAISGLAVGSIYYAGMGFLLGGTADESETRQDIEACASALQDNISHAPKVPTQCDQWSFSYRQTTIASVSDNGTYHYTYEPKEYVLPSAESFRTIHLGRLETNTERDARINRWKNVAAIVGGLSAGLVFSRKNPTTRVVKDSVEDCKIGTQPNL